MTFNPSQFTAVPRPDQKFNPKLLNNIEVASYGYDKGKIWYAYDMDRESLYQSIKGGLENSLELAGLLATSSDGEVSLKVFIEGIEVEGLLNQSIKVTTRYELSGSGFDESYTVLTKQEPLPGPYFLTNYMDGVERNFDEFIARLSKL